MTAPQGTQHVISRDEHRVVVVEVGGGLRTYTLDDRPVLDGYAEDEACEGARGQPLIPWPNRVRDGAYTWDGDALQLALTEPEQHNAIHGLLRFTAWSVAEQRADHLAMTATAWPQIGFPFLVRATVEYSLGADGLTVRTTGKNLGDAAAPWAVGAHPYVTVGTDLIDDALLELPARSWLPTGNQQAPVGTEPVDGTPYDFRTSRRLGDVQIDYAFTELERDESGLAVVRVAAPDGGRGVEMWVDRSFPYVEVFTGDALPTVARRRRGLGLEPMTCPPNGYQTGTDVVRLEPGASHVSEWGLRPWTRG